MVEDLPLNIVREWHDATLEAGGTVREVHRIRYMLGRFGPYDATFDRNPNPIDVQNTINDRRNALRAILAS